MVPLGRAGGVDHDHPPAPVGVLVDRIRRIRKLAVDLGHLARQGREEIGDCLDRLHDTKGLLRLDLGADFGQLHEHDVTQLLLGKRGDADADPGAFLLGPLEITRVLEVGWNVGDRGPSGWSVQSSRLDTVEPESRPGTSVDGVHAGFLTRDGWNGVRTTRAGRAWPRISTASSVPTFEW